MATTKVNVKWASGLVLICLTVICLMCLPAQALADEPGAATPAGEYGGEADGGLLLPADADPAQGGAAEGEVTSAPDDDGASEPSGDQEPAVDEGDTEAPDPAGDVAEPVDAPAHPVDAGSSEGETAGCEGVPAVESHEAEPAETPVEDAAQQGESGLSGNEPTAGEPTSATNPDVAAALASSAPSAQSAAASDTAPAASAATGATPQPGSGEAPAGGARVPARKAIPAATGSSAKTAAAPSHAAAKIAPQAAKQAAAQAAKQAAPQAALSGSKVVTLGSKASKRLRADIPNASAKAGVAVKLFAGNESPAQRFRIVRLAKSQYSAIYSVASKLALGFTGKARSGAPVKQAAYRGLDSQKWLVARNADGTYTFYSAITAKGKMLALDAAAAVKAPGRKGLTVRVANGSAAQKWSLGNTEPIATGSYVIHSGVADKRALDVEGASKRNGANVSVFTLNRGNAQVFTVKYEAKTGYYLVKNRFSGKAVISVGAAGSGNVEQGKAGSSWRARWSIVSTGKKGAFRLANAGTGAYLDVSGASTEPGANVVEYEKKSGKNQVWRFEQTSAYRSKVDARGVSSLIRSKRVGTQTYLFLPSYANLKAVKLAKTSPLAAVYVASSENGKYRKVTLSKPIDLSTFKRDKKGAYTLYVKPGSAYLPSTLKVMKSASIRAMHLTSANPTKKGRSYVERSANHATEAKGSMVLVTKGGKVAYNGKLDQIRGRGNSTWEAEKKPYQIKLADKASLLDGTDANAAKTWLLLANAYDDTMIRNYLALKTARAIGMENSPDCEFVDLYYDGEYVGNYLLTEKNQVNKGRVDIAEIENTSTNKKDISTHKTAVGKNKYGMAFQYVKGVKQPKDITGGYLVELDNWYYDKERSWFKTSVGYFVLKSPEDASKAEVKYISEKMQAAIKTLGKADGNAKARVDLESLAQAHLVNELVKNPDYVRASSTYFYKDKGADVIHAGPAWDFDLSFGVHVTKESHSYESPEGFASAGYSDFYTNNKQFKAALKKVYKRDFLPQAKGLVTASKSSSLKTITQAQNMVRKSVAMERVFHASETSAFISADFTSFKQAVAYTKEWTKLRLNWMNSAIAGGKALFAVQAPIEEGAYSLESALGGALGVARASRDDLANVEITAVDGMAAQPFRFQVAGKAATGETLYRIVSVLSEKALAVDAAGNVLQVKASSAPEQRWVVRTWPGGGRYVLVNASNQRVLDVSGGLSKRGANVLTWDLTGGSNQFWLFR